MSEMTDAEQDAVVQATADDSTPDDEDDAGDIDLDDPDDPDDPDDRTRRRC